MSDVIDTPEALGLRGPGPNADQLALIAAAAGHAADAQAAAGNAIAASQTAVDQALPSDRSIPPVSVRTGTVVVAGDGTTRAIDGYTTVRFPVAQAGSLVLYKSVFQNGGYGPAFGNASGYVSGLTGGGIPAGTPIPVPDGATFIDVTVAPADASGIRAIAGTVAPAHWRDPGLADTMTAARIAAGRVAASIGPANLFDPDRLDTTRGSIINPVTGVIAAVPGYLVTHPIRCIPGEPMVCDRGYGGNAGGGRAYYDAGGIFIGGIAGPYAAGSRLDHPEGAHTVRMTLDAADVAGFTVSPHVYPGVALPWTPRAFGMVDANAVALGAAAAVRRARPVDFDIYDSTASLPGAIGLDGTLINAANGYRYTALCDAPSDFLTFSRKNGLGAGYAGLIWYADLAGTIPCRVVAGEIGPNVRIPKPSAALTWRATIYDDGHETLEIQADRDISPQALGWSDVRRLYPTIAMNLMTLGDSTEADVTGGQARALATVQEARCVLAIDGAISGNRVRELLDVGPNTNVLKYSAENLSSIHAIHMVAALNNWGLWDAASGSFPWYYSTPIGEIGDPHPAIGALTGVAGQSSVTVTSLTRGRPAMGQPLLIPQVTQGTMVTGVPGSADGLGVYQVSKPIPADIAQPIGFLASTFCGEWEYIFDTLEAFEAQTGQMPIRKTMETPTKRFDRGTTGDPVNAWGSSLGQYAAKMVQIGRAKGAPVLDTFAECGLTPANAAYYLLAAADDGFGGLHPKRPFSVQLGHRAGRFLRRIQ